MRVEKKVFGLIFSSALVAASASVGVGDIEKTLEKNCPTIGEQKQIPILSTLFDGKIIKKGVSVAECQSNHRWYNDGTRYLTSPIPLRSR